MLLFVISLISYVMPFILAVFFEKKNSQCAKDLRWLGLLSLVIVPIIAISLFILPPAGEKGLGTWTLGIINIACGWLSPFVLFVMGLFEDAYDDSYEILVSAVQLLLLPIVMAYIYLLHPGKHSVSFLITRALLSFWVINIIFSFGLSYL